jgi:hypothetical protein
MGGEVLWTRRRAWGRWLLAVVVAGSVAWSYVLLGRSADWYPWLRWVVLALGVTGAVAIAVFRPTARRGAFALVRRLGLGVSVAAVLLGPAAYTLQTVTTPHSGSIVTAGPNVAGGLGGPGGFGGRGMPSGGNVPGGMEPPDGMQFPGGADAGQGAGGAPNGQSGQGDANGQAGPGVGQADPGGQTGANRQTDPNGGSAGSGAQGFPGMGDFDPQNFGGRSSGPGGFGGFDGGDGTISDELKQVLTANASNFRWMAATTSSQNAATYQLATGYSVMPIGGFTGSDPSPTLDQFKTWVAEGQIHYFIGSGGFGGGFGGGQGGGQGGTGDISSWVAQNFTATTVGGVTLYDLTQPAGSTTSDSATTGTTSNT